MASSVTEVGNPQQGGKKGKDKNKDLAVLVDDKLTEVNNSILTLTGRVDEMEKRIEELESEGDLEELRGEMQVAVNFVVVDVNKEVQVLRASEDAKGEELKACRAKIEAYKTRIKALEAQLKLCMPRWPTWVLVDQVKYPLPRRAMHSQTQPTMSRGMQEKLTTSFGSSRLTSERPGS